MNFSSRQTATVAATVLSVLATFQLVVVFIVLARNPVAEKSNPPVPGVASISVQPVLPLDSGMALATPTLPKSEPTPAPISTPAALAEVEAEVVPTEVEILVKRAVEIRAKGDMTGALSSLRDADRLYPDNPKIVAEFAATYEQMGLVDKALAQWRRVVAAGDAAGDLYGVATEKVRVGVIPPEPSLGRDDEGLQPGSSLGLVDVQKKYSINGDGTEDVKLRMGIKTRPDRPLSVADVNIQAMFYDLVGNTEVQPSDERTTKVTSDWLTAPADWKEDGVEVLTVQYQQNPPAPEDNPAEQRKYLGYIIRVYYENELQDVIAEPAKLLQNFPPAVTLQKEIPE